MPKTRRKNKIKRRAYKEEKQSMRIKGMAQKKKIQRSQKLRQSKPVWEKYERPKPSILFAEIA